MSDKHIPNFSRLSKEEKQALVQTLLTSEKHRREKANPEHSDLEISGFHRILALLGLPAESNPKALERFPLITVSTVVVTSIVSFLCFTDEHLFMDLAFIPADPWRAGGLTMLSCFLVHGGFFHLFSNMYALFVFGDNAEDVLGRVRYLLLLLLATFGASFVSGMVSGQETVPHVGASGGVFGVIVFYLLRFPRAKFTYFFMFQFFQVPAAVVLGIYAFTQFIGGVQQVGGATNIDHVAHIAGGTIGLMFWLLYGRNTEDEMPS